jgi:hypothetical protein
MVVATPLLLLILLLLKLLLLLMDYVLRRKFDAVSHYMHAYLLETIS